MGDEFPSLDIPELIPVPSGPLGEDESTPSMVLPSLKLLFTSNDNENSELNKELECPICLETFKIPRLLACTHTFCTSCLEQIVVGKQGDESGVIVTCPTCREITQIKEDVPSSLYPNYIVQSLINKLEDTSPNYRTCSECVDQTKAEDFCYDCKLAFCTDCSTHHRKSKRYSSHRIENIDLVKPEKMQHTHDYCRTHNELLKYFCKDCGILVCQDCMISKSHSKHERGLIEEILEEKQEEVKGLINKGKERVEALHKFYAKMDEALQEKGKASDVIEEAFNYVIERITERKEELMKTVNDPYNASVTTVENAKQKGKVLDDTLEYASTLLVSEEKENLEALSGLVKQLGNTLSDCEITDPLETNIDTSKGETNNGTHFVVYDTDGKTYYKDPASGRCYTLHDGYFHDEIKETSWLKIYTKKLIQNAKIGKIDINIENIDAVLKGENHKDYVEDSGQF